MKFSDMLKEKPSDWNLKYSDYKIIINDTLKHNLIDKFNERTKEDLESINLKVQKAIDTCMKHFEFQKASNRLEYCVNYLLSKFKLVISVDKTSKNIAFITILSQRMHANANFIRDLYESNEFIEILINL